ncbi:MAG: acetyl-CoA carboxylase biotin carboxyl carrier protein [Rhodospirillales bacterium]|nr:acetyl-CoA carboxylase biotin carboxyl carrier protein [Rhodospirillales bacterium]MBT4006187.1 acetyl-CoA carboxylase biotin carboxyl carrier protein [Rhodospirillales bacterium]MBT5075880.1 acetyl-CoA carboxylase biotin carboxyl carrier protein [Rhodospirillales bacterium]MBT5114368.1 acetyl-CoA carboxylase biotin carboxyl carrier protein [Rhodospirillales bacterium]MBT5672760.1 acetyl-CoA carboxylase biotin carboxyl carrier protein [Rhodospirillales bacterium]
MTRKHPVDEELIKRLSELLDENGLTELEYGEGKWHVRVSRASGGSAVHVAAPTSSATDATSAGNAEETSAANIASHPGAVTSPMVGTAYSAPEPGAPAFIKVGDTVSEGQTLMLVEAMKTMNPIRAPRAGLVAQILVGNAAPVEYGEVLLILE